MAFSHVASHGLAALAASWTLYALAASGAGNVLLTQTAYQAGQPMITLPVIAAVTPLASAAVGIGLLGEAPGTGLAGGVAAGLAVLITSVALAFLARSAPTPNPGTTGRHTGNAAAWRYCPGRPVPVAPRSAPRGGALLAPGFPPAWQASHAPARRRLQIIPSGHGSNDCPGCPGAEQNGGSPPSPQPADVTQCVLCFGARTP